ncbi:MAG: hypothetical protein HZA58_07365 [Acidimicrobiia bacterium]|nr:hypothetical protein [Acidimicrobiia bacterium]
MGAQHTRDFSSPDDTFAVGGLLSQRVALGAHTVSRAIHQPGWRWSTHARTTGMADSCQTHHVGYALAGTMRVVLADGTEFDVTGGSVFDIPPDHDAWVVGDEPYEAIDWVGARSWLAATRTLSTVVATILFTDVVDSSGQARRRGDSIWNDLNTTLTQQTRETVSEFGGDFIKATGDGALAAFAGAARAVGCGIELAAMAPHLGIAIRVGVHTGEVEVIEGDVHGIAVNEAARVLAAAAPGEVLVSEVTHAIVGGAAFSFADRGEHELKGIGTRHLFAVTKAR